MEVPARSTKQYGVRLSPDERAEARRFMATGTAAAWSLARARISLKADAGADGPRWTDAQIAEAVEVSARTVARTRAALATGGLAAARHRQAPTRTDPRRLDSAGEAQLVTLACSAPPTGHVRWTLRLLAGRLVALEVVDGISPETVRQALKKTCSNLG